MAYEIILGRDDKTREQLGLTGTILLGKHYVKMGQTTALSQPVYLDLNKAHVVFVAGKRGSGKSYSLGVIAEGISQLPPEISRKLSVILLDTMGIYWSMKYPNHQDEELLKEWGQEGHAITQTKIYTPAGFYKHYKEQGIPTDAPFSIKPSELAPEDWNLTFDITATDPIAVFIERIILDLKERGADYDIDDILQRIRSDEREEARVKQVAENRYIAVQAWGVFHKEATPLKELAKGAQITILDLSCYAVLPNGWKIKHLVLGLVCSKLFIERMTARKMEEYETIASAVHYFAEEKEKEHMPIVWLMVDEAHEFLPNTGKTAATDALVALLREGRQPGVALVLATQQPGKIHTDAMTQADVILAHRLTAKIDTDALGALVQNYLRSGLDKELDNLPRVAGACLAMDDVNERLYPMRVRPRFSWHGGGAPGVVGVKKQLYTF